MKFLRIIILTMALFSIVEEWSQSPLSADSLASLFAEYYGEVPEEKIYVHTDRDYYVPGDSVWFRIFVVDAVTNALSDKSKFAYLELHDNKADTLVRRIKVKADNDGVFANVLALPENMKSGNYTLASYTRLMQNSDQSRFFKKSLKIMNPDSVAGIGQRHRELKSISLSLMPEGGSLLAGHLQRLAFKAIGDDGLGVDVRVMLVKGNGEIVSEGASQHLGMGTLLVEAEADEELWLEAVAIDGLSCRDKLPAAQTYGASLTVNQRNGMVFVQPYFTPAIEAKDVAMVIYGSGNMMVMELNDASSIKIAAEDLRPGVVNIALVDRLKRRVLAERLIFVRDTNHTDIQVVKE